MMQAIFGGLMGISLLYGLIRGTADRVMAAMLEAAGEAVQSAIALAGGFAFFCGLMAILRRAGAAEALGKRIAPALRLLMSRELPPDALEPVTLNLAANMLGLGNAATPMGIEASRRLARDGRATNALCLFLVINASSVQLLPATVIALRAAAGSARPGAVALPAFLATALSTVTGIVCCKAAEKWM